MVKIFHIENIALICYLTVNILSVGIQLEMQIYMHSYSFTASSY